MTLTVTTADVAEDEMEATAEDSDGAGAQRSQGADGAASAHYQGGGWRCC